MSDETIDSVRVEFFPWRSSHFDVQVKAVERSEFLEKFFPFAKEVLAPPRPLVSGFHERLGANQLRHSAFRAWHQEHFVALQAGKPIAWMRGNLRDRETFYLATSGVHESYRAGRWMRPAYLHILEYLRRLGYERVTSLHKPTNRSAIIMQLKNGFVVDGVVLDERVGPLVSMVKHLHPDLDDEFRERFRLPARADRSSASIDAD